MKANYAPSVLSFGECRSMQAFYISCLILKDFRLTKWPELIPNFKYSIFFLFRFSGFLFLSYGFLTVWIVYACTTTFLSVQKKKKIIYSILDREIIFTLFFIFTPLFSTFSKTIHTLLTLKKTAWISKSRVWDRNRFWVVRSDQFFRFF